MDKNSYLSHTWVHPALFVNKSKIDQKGIFTSDPIAKGEKVMIFGGILANINDLDENKYRLLSMFPMSDEIYLGLPITDTSESIDEYLNHSCNPNVWLIDEVTVVARRDLKTGEEVTMDCATWDSDPSYTYSNDGKCYCESTLCRKVLSHDDWKKPELQTRYKGHFAPYIQRKIDNLISSV